MIEKCPKCENATEEKLMGDSNTKIDKCEKCHGLWFEFGELAMIHGEDEDAIEFWQRVEKGKVTDIACPSCPELKLIEMSYLNQPLFGRHDIHIDFCISCHGMWLDDGELPKVIKLAEAKKFKGNFVEVRRILES